MMSEAPQSEMSTATGSTSTGGGGQDEGRSKLPLIIILLLLLLGIGAVIFFVTRSSSTEATEGSGEGGPGGNGNPSIVDPPILQTTTTTPKPYERKQLVCTIGPTGVLSTMVPPDGTCDYIFYTEVFFNDAEKKILPLMGSIAFDVLKAKAATYKTTTFGTSMVTSSITNFIGKMDKDVKAAMAQLLADKFMHSGCLLVEDFEKYSAHGDTLKFLGLAAAFAGEQKDPSQVQVALGVGALDSASASELMKNAKQATVDVPGITLIILKVHVDKVGSAAELYPTGPNPEKALDAKYKILTLGNIEKDLKANLEAISSDGTRVAMLSFAMYARAYRMPTGWSDAADRAKVAENGIAMDYARMCNATMEAETMSDMMAKYVANTTQRFLGVFDDVASFTQKTTKRLEKMPTNNTGFGIYHVEMDDFDGTCGDKFARLMAIKKTLTS